MAAINRPIKLKNTKTDLSFPMNKSVTSTIIPKKDKTSTGARLIRSMAGAGIGSKIFIPFSSLLLLIKSCYLFYLDQLRMCRVT